MKLFILGHGEHGKGEACRILRDLRGLESVSSSWMVASQVRVYLHLKHGLTYASPKECYDDRRNHRAEWYDAIQAYNKNDLTRLSRAIFSKYDIYDGIRSRDEFLASKHLANLSVWIERPGWKRDASCQVRMDDCDVVVYNSGATNKLRKRLTMMFGTREKQTGG